uniref:Uncharacterized protein n=1 Tax=Magallana gigas TaxID=29159 RepID=A0A8W8JEG8_MAGGI|nr:uncharacterized protein LOC117692058 isoform X1 [Crassostrea gigas]XP_034334912.1 uncharacterized protein LOC117692058 isoform X1 [Crassostrea gigas]XP_034334913.1 uncharacterized protein LOC117692058 isoform X1 [Crassostrea gigas]XP_034334914.1 uncharacterized protein LOC117692058 isoform X1 [Crassostrea gigas]
MMSVLCAIMFASGAFFSLASSMCPESIPTVSIVSRCPSNAMEWKSAAERKKCDFLGKIQNCTQAENFVYHCVLNKETTELLELCAPVWFMAGYCARFSEVNKRIINDPGLDCTKFDPPCPSRFPSNESYKYQTCYRSIIEKTFVFQQRMYMSADFNTSVPSAFAVSFGIILVLLILLFVVGFKLEWIKFTIPCLKKDDIEKQTGDQNEAVETPLLEANKEKNEGGEKTAKVENMCTQKVEDIRQFGIHSLSGDVEENCYLRDVKTIGDLRDLLSAKIKKPKGLLLLVDREKGIIFNDDTEIETLIAMPNEMMIGNQNRMTATGEDDKTPVDDVISNKLLTVGKCKMWCGHWTAPNSLFDWTKEKLPGALTEGLPCPKCSKMWNIDDLIEKCKMSPDERLFFKSVETIIKRNVELAK